MKLRPELLQKHQQYVKEKTGAKDDKPVFLVFHGGSGSGVKDFQDAISYGVVKASSPSWPGNTVFWVWSLLANFNFLVKFTFWQIPLT